MQIERFEGKTTRNNNFLGKKILFMSCTGGIDLLSFYKFTKKAEFPILPILFLLENLLFHIFSQVIIKLIQSFKTCACYIFASLFRMFKKEHFWNKKKKFLFHFESSFRSWGYQILTFQIFKYHGVIKCLSMKHETHFTE